MKKNASPAPAVLAGVWIALTLATPGWAQSPPPAAAPRAAAEATAPPVTSAPASAAPSAARSPAAPPPNSAPAKEGEPGAPLELPAFRPGWWEYSRTVTTTRGRGRPQTTTVKKCSDPSQEFKEKQAQLSRRGCRFSPLSRQDREYHSNWNCPGTDGLIIFDDVLTVFNELSYQDRSEIRYIPQSSRTSTSLITAKWLGRCPIVPSAAASH